MIKKRPEDRIIKRQNRKFLNNITTGKSKYEVEITWEELERVVGETKAKEAPGDYTIPYDIIKELGPKVKKYIYICTTGYGTESRFHNAGGWQ